MTEDEAKKKWCPFSRVPHQLTRNQLTVDYVVSNRAPSIGDAPENSFCIGLSCMAWRWRVENADEGYCGLAGKLYD